MPPQLPYRQQLLPSITQGLSPPVAAAALGTTRQTIATSRRRALQPVAADHVLAVKYPPNTHRQRNIAQKHAALNWLRDTLPVKSGSKQETHVQYDTDQQLYSDYKQAMAHIDTGQYTWRACSSAKHAPFSFIFGALDWACCALQVRNQHFGLQFRK